MTNRAVDRIKKLLRVARSTSNEAESKLALARARDLMERYHIEVSEEDEPEYREVIDVAAEFWCRRLVISVARLNGCSVRLPIKSDDARVLVTGPRDRVHAAIAHFRFLYLTIALAAYRSWHEYLPRSSITVQLEEEISREIYARGFLSEATAIIAQRSAEIRTGAKPATQYERPPADVLRQIAIYKDEVEPETEKSPIEQEIYEFSEEARRLAGIIGPESALEIIQRSATDGRRTSIFVNELQRSWCASHLLMASRPATRFSLLEID